MILRPLKKRIRSAWLCFVIPIGSTAAFLLPLLKQAGAPEYRRRQIHVAVRQGGLTGHPDTRHADCLRHLPRDNRTILLVGSILRNWRRRRLAVVSSRDLFVLRLETHCERVRGE